MFRTFGGGFPGQRPPPQGEPPSMAAQLTQLLPILFMLLLTFFALKPSEPVRPCSNLAMTIVATASPRNFDIRLQKINSDCTVVG